MKKVKVLASIAALAAVTCMAAVTASAASSIDFELDTAKSNATTKVVNVNLVTDELTNVSTASFMIELDGTASCTSTWCTPEFDLYEGNQYVLLCSASGGVDITNGVVTLATLTMDTDTFNATAIFDPEYDAINSSQGVALSACEAGSFAVVDAETVEFEAGEGDAAKAFMATAAGEGVITWNVTDGTNVATATGTTVTGGAEVVAGLVVTGANVGNISYAAVTID